MLKDKFVQDDALRSRRKLGPLGWIVLGIVLLFVLVCLAGTYSLVTRNVAELAPHEPSASSTSTTLTAATLSPNVSATAPITWTVWIAKDPMGQTIYDGPVDVKAWALRDYVAAQTWFNAHLLDKDYLLQHLDEYYAGKAREDGWTNLTRAFGETFVIMAPPIAQPRQPAPMDKPLFVSFSPDGRAMRLNDYTDAGPAKQYDTRTRKPIAVSLKNKFLWQYLVEFDALAERWKIARNTQIINIDTGTLVLSDEP